MKNLLTLYKKIKRGGVRAFTLLETMGAIAILSTFVLGPLTVAINSTSYSRQTKDVIVSTYLAEESIELLRNQYDSLFIYCKSTSLSPCAPSGSETSAQVAWRVFKERLGSVSTTQCFSTNGCTYDFMNLTTTPDAGFTVYDPTGSECPLMALEKKATSATDFRNIFVCSGVPEHLTGTPPLSKAYHRVVKIESLPTFSETGESYSDDLRITASITFKSPSGLDRTVTVTDFLHARQ
jgi:type II secretory pathway pseudopilin PulG